MAIANRILLGAAVAASAALVSGALMTGTGVASLALAADGSPAAVTTATPVTSPTAVITQAPVTTPTPVITQAPVTTATPVTSPTAVTTQAPVMTPTPVTTQTPVTTPTPVTSPATLSGRFAFRTLNDNQDPTFNQLLGINDSGVIAGYFGSGAQGHPNQGYTLRPPYRQQDYRMRNFPGSVQTQVTGLNNLGVSVGFWSGMNNASQSNDNFGFYHRRFFHNVNFPTPDNASPPVNQLLGINDHGTAVGFYTDAQGSSHGYRFSIWTGAFSTVSVPGAGSLTAAAINDRGDVAGFMAGSGGVTDGFLLQAGGRVITLAVPGATMTQAFGLNNEGEVVGAYQTGTGSAAATHGFTWTARRGFTTVDDPSGAGTTTVNGVNDEGDLVGFYVDAAGNTDGMLALPRH
jgi:hypothetical protein